MDESNKIPLKRYPLFAGFLSFILPGLGLMYCGKLAKGILVYILFLISSLIFTLLTLLISSFFVVIHLLLYVFIIVYTVIQCVKVKEYVLKPYNIWYYYILFYIVAIIISNMIEIPFIKSVFFEAYCIPTGSMENTLLVGDYIMDNKYSYGLHIPFSDSYLSKFKNPDYNDMVVFNLLEKDDKSQKYNEIKYIKRCVALPTDTLRIIKKILYINNKFQNPLPGIQTNGKSLPENVTNSKIFPSHSGWNEDYYGPIRIPKAGDIVALDSSNIELWKDLIINEGHTIRMFEKKVYIDDKLSEDGKYTVEKNYIFLLGDNRNNSLDSRFFGFISTDKVVGKANTIYWSWDDKISFFEPFHKIASIRWNRIGLKLK